MSVETIKQSPGSKDCLACVAAMAAQTSVEDFKKYYRDNELPFDDDMTLIRYLAEHGYLVGIFTPDDSRWPFEALTNVNLTPGPAYVVVESDLEWVRKQGAHHAVYWDGKTLYDPAPASGSKKLSEYEIVMFLPLCKNAEHPRWKKTEV